MSGTGILYELQRRAKRLREQGDQYWVYDGHRSESVSTLREFCVSPTDDYRITTARDHDGISRPVSVHWESTPTGPLEDEMGTKWVEPGKGSTWVELVKAFHGWSKKAYATNMKRFSLFMGIEKYPFGPRTNLLLTGEPITDDDRKRWKSGNVG